MNQTTNTDVTNDDKLWSLVSYIFPIIGLVLLLIDDKKNRPFIRYNAIQSLMLGAISLVLTFAFVGFLLWIYSIYLGLKSYNGETVTIPLLTDFGKSQNWL
jgi:uncharacterized membrane protein